ncbi:hypothetical protein IVB27_32425 [Bradyrhizobium sp. 197]|uniref:hypothetical protein n=1 Tax=Bradyrhizobium sp. 197 TaxID=2782663 RepID=UPI001FFA081E|nr:hypothetical protein [Bradyrhizobium sp. 197]MCK1479321.1 hypothetical protein [Bradyrhizobium sp. 197]
MADDQGADTGADDTKLADKGADTGADKGAGTILDAADKGGDDKGSDAGAADKDAGKAEPDWRSRMAGGDDAFLKRLARFPDEATFAKSFRSLEQKMSSGEYKKPLAENATPEEKATWRKENGLPEKADEYVAKLALPNGMVIGEAEKPVVAELAAVAHESNLDPKAFNGLVAKYYEIQDQARQKQEDADVAFKLESEDALRKDWQGPDFRRNLTAVNNLISTWPEGLASTVLAGRGPDGRKLGDNPAFIRQLAVLATELNPAATLVPAGTTDPGKNVQARLEEIRTLRRNDPNAYEQNKAMQAEELELIDADLKMQKRGKAA